MNWQEKRDDEGRLLTKYLKEENGGVLCVACNIKIVISHASDISPYDQINST